MSLLSFKDILLGDNGKKVAGSSSIPGKRGLQGLEDITNKSGNHGLKQKKKLEDSTNMQRKMRVEDITDSSCNRGLKQKKEFENSVNKSCQKAAYKGGLDWKKLNWGVWSLKPITLKVNPGCIVVLENILLSRKVRVKKRSLVKECQEVYKDKYVCIVMLSMSSSHAESTVRDTIMLRDVHYQIESSGGKFEVICVPTHFEAGLERKYLDYDEYLNPYQLHLHLKFYSSFHHIHINDDSSLNQISSTIGLPKDQETTHVILGPVISGSNRKVVSIFDSDFIRWYGAEAYPFTIGKIQQLALEDEALRREKHNLVTLLCGPSRDYVISNDCTKVPISELQKKTICIFFYEDHCECQKGTEELKQVYELHKDFEVVVVFPTNFGQNATIHRPGVNKRVREFEFWKVFHNMPWLAVPFEDPKCRQLWRVFMRTKMCNEPKLMIIHSEGNYFVENGFQILKETGFTKYPFTGKKVAPSAIAIRGKKLSTVLKPNVELLRVTCLDDAKGKLEGFQVSKLFGAPVVFLFVQAPGFSEFLSQLQFYHRITNDGGDKFEVVYIPMIEFAPDIDSHWMLSSPSPEFNKKHLVPLLHHFFKDDISQNAEKEITLALVTFGNFGHYSNRGIIYSNSYESAYELFLNTFPFQDDKEKKTFEIICPRVLSKKTNE